MSVTSEIATAVFPSGFCDRGVLPSTDMPFNVEMPAAGVGQALFGGRGNVANFNGIALLTDSTAVCLQYDIVGRFKQCSPRGLCAT